MGFTGGECTGGELTGVGFTDVGCTGGELTGVGFTDVECTGAKLAAPGSAGQGPGRVSGTGRPPEAGRPRRAVAASNQPRSLPGPIAFAGLTACSGAAVFAGVAACSGAAVFAGAAACSGAAVFAGVAACSGAAVFAGAAAHSGPSAWPRPPACPGSAAIPWSGACPGGDFRLRVSQSVRHERGLGREWLAQRPALVVFLQATRLHGGALCPRRDLRFPRRYLGPPRRRLSWIGHRPSRCVPAPVTLPGTARAGQAARRAGCRAGLAAAR